MIHARAAAAKNINSAADAKNKKEGEAMVELDQFKVTLISYETPLAEVRDSL